MERRHGGKGAGRKPSIRRSMLANRLLGIATSANWNLIYRPCRTTLAPILISLDRLCRSSPQRGQRPLLDLLGQGQRPQEVGHVVGQHVQLETHLVVAEAVAG